MLCGRTRASRRRETRPLKVAVLGIGLIGGSIGLAARLRAGAQVCGYDPDAAAARRALALGAIDTQAADLPAARRTTPTSSSPPAPVGALPETVRAALAGAGPRMRRQRRRLDQAPAGAPPRATSASSAGTR